jgi:hypothetical protein
MYPKVGFHIPFPEHRSLILSRSINWRYIQKPCAILYLMPIFRSFTFIYWIMRFSVTTCLGLSVQGSYTRIYPEEFIRVNTDYNQTIYYYFRFYNRKRVPCWHSTPIQLRYILKPYPSIQILLPLNRPRQLIVNLTITLHVKRR